MIVITEVLSHTLSNTRDFPPYTMLKSYLERMNRKMSFPTIPQINPTISLNRSQVINLLLASVAFEELGLAHIINAEGEKLQAALGTLPGASEHVAVTTFQGLISINREVRRTLQTALKSQMLLQFKLEKILDIPPV